MQRLVDEQFDDSQEMHEHELEDIDDILQTQAREVYWIGERIEFLTQIIDIMKHWILEYCIY